MANDLHHQLGQILMLTTRDFHRRLADDLSQRGVEGVGPRQKSVFLHLGRLGPSRSVDLAEAAGIRPQSMMAVVHELEERDMIERRPDPSDSRAKLIYFTKKGEEFIRQLTLSTESVWTQYADILGENHLRNVVNGMQEILCAKEGASNDDG